METTPLIWALLIVLALFIFAIARHHRMLPGIYAFRHAHHAWHRHQRQHLLYHLSAQPFFSPRDRQAKLHHSREFCKAYTAQRMSQLLQGLEDRVKPTSTQQDDWQQLRQALLNESEYLNDICEKQRLEHSTESAPARVELLATVKLMENEFLLRLQPPILRLYLKLDDQQRRNFDKIFNWHCHGHWI